MLILFDLKHFQVLAEFFCFNIFVLLRHDSTRSSSLHCPRLKIAGKVFLKVVAMPLHRTPTQIKLNIYVSNVVVRTVNNVEKTFAIFVGITARHFLAQCTDAERREKKINYRMQLVTEWIAEVTVKFKFG